MRRAEDPSGPDSGEVAEALPPVLALLALAYAAPAAGPGSLRAAFHTACFDGELPLARALLALGPSPAPRGRRALRHACAGGRLAVARWLADRFALTAADARHPGDTPGPRPSPEAPLSPLAAASGGGHLETAQWLVGRFGFAAATHRAFGVSALREACERGHLPVARWLAAHFGLAAAGLRHRGGHILRLACENGHLEAAAWLADTFALTARDALAGQCGCGERTSPLTGACGRGRLEVAQWLAKRFGLATADVGEQGAALSAACGGGHLETARWLADALGLQAADVRARGCDALGRACLNGHLVTAQWLAARFGLSRFDAWQARALERACSRGHLEVVQWLVEHLGMASGAPPAVLAGALSCACAHGHLAAARWLADRLLLTAESLRARDGDGVADVLRVACAGGHLAAVEWLVARFGAPSRPALLDALREACENGHLAVARWLAGRPAAEDGPGWRDQGAADDLLCAAGRGGHLPVIVWLVEESGFSPSDAAALREFADACVEGNLAIARYLSDIFVLLGTEALAALRDVGADPAPEVEVWLAERFQWAGAGPEAPAPEDDERPPAPARLMQAPRGRAGAPPVLEE